MVKEKWDTKPATELDTGVIRLEKGSVGDKEENKSFSDLPSGTLQRRKRNKACGKEMRGKGANAREHRVGGKENYELEGGGLKRDELIEEVTTIKNLGKVSKKGEEGEGGRGRWGRRAVEKSIVEKEGLLKGGKFLKGWVVNTKMCRIVRSFIGKGRGESHENQKGKMKEKSIHSDEGGKEE